MQLHRPFRSYHLIRLTTCLSLVACLVASLVYPKSSWADTDEVVPSNETSYAIPEDISELINAYRYESAYKRVEALLHQDSINEQNWKNLLHRIEGESTTHSKANIQTAYQLSRQYRWEEAEFLLSVLSTQVVDKEPVEEAKKVINQNPNRQLLIIESNTALQKQSWLQQQNELNQFHNRSTPRNLFSRTKKYWMDFKLDRHNRYLLKLAQQNIEFEEYSMSQQCLDAIEPEGLSDKNKDQFDKLATLTYSHMSVAAAKAEKPAKQEKPEIPEITSIPPKSVNTLTDSLEDNIRENNLLAIKFNLDELDPLTSNQSSHKPLVDQAEAYLENEIVKLDQAADDLYRTEQPLEAYEIWELLLELDRDNDAIQQKFDRAEIVLGNMKTLRAQGNASPLPVIH